MSCLYAYQGHPGFIAAVEGRLEEAGFHRTEDPAAAEIVLTFSTSQSQLEDLYFGDGGLVQVAAPRTLMVDMSATTPNFAREIAAVATVSDLVMVEAPLVVDDIARTDAFARDNLSCFVSGEEDGVDRAREVLDALFAHVVEAGGLGAAQLARAAESLQMAAGAVAAIEAQALYNAQRRSVSGGDVGKLQPRALAPRVQTMLDAVHHGRFDGPYTVEMFMSELSSAITAADDAELILPQAEAALHLLELLAVIGGTDKAPAALSLVYGEEADCAKNGLDWSRAEETYGGGHDHDRDDEDEDDEGRGFDLGLSYDDFDYDDPYSDFGYSSN